MKISFEWIQLNFEFTKKSFKSHYFLYNVRQIINLFNKRLKQYIAYEDIIRVQIDRYIKIIFVITILVSTI